MLEGEKAWQESNRNLTEKEDGMKDGSAGEEMKGSEGRRGTTGVETGMRRLRSEGEMEYRN